MSKHVLEFSKLTNADGEQVHRVTLFDDTTQSIDVFDAKLSTAAESAHAEEQAKIALLAAKQLAVITVADESKADEL